MEPYPSGQFGLIDDPDRQFGNGSVWTWTWTGSDGPEPLLTLPPSASPNSLDHGLPVHLQTRAIMDSKYIIKKRQWVYGYPGVTEVE